MEIHRFETLWTAASLVLIVAFIGTVTYGAVVAGVAMVGDSGTVDANALDSHPEFGDPGVRSVTEDGERRADVYVVAKQFLFDPGTSSPIRVPADTEVTFHVTSSDVTHGFALPGTNVNTMVIPGQVTEVTVEFEETREYGIVCHEYCGAGHHDMAGTVQVVPRSQFFGEEDEQ